MNNLIIRKASEEDISLIQDLIKCLALYEKRPQDMTGSQEKLNYWLFERNIATVLIAEYNGEAIGYAIYYPTFGSFSAIGKVYLEDLFIKETYRHHGFGKYFLSKIADRVLEEGYSEMEWSCLKWNKSSITFYKNLGAMHETGRDYFEFNKSQLIEVASLVNREKIE